MRRLCFALCLLLHAGGVASSAPADCEPRRGLTPKPANLDKILKDHSRWLATWNTPTPKGIQADLSYRDLTGAVFADSDLRQVKFTGSNLQGAKLDRARLDMAELTCVLADSASFVGADLFQVTLTNGSLVGSNLTQAKLGGAILAGAELTNTDFSGADMRRAILTSATLRNTKLKDARFADVDLLKAVWQPLDLPEVGTMGSAANLRTIRLYAASPDPGAMTRLVAALREAGLEARAKEAAHARERAMTTLDLAKWKKDADIISLGWAGFRMAVGCVTDYGLSLTRGLIVLLGCTLLFVPVYFQWGFSRARDRNTGIVTITPEKTLVSGTPGERLTTEATVDRLMPATTGGRWLWAACFACVTAVRSGVGPVNLLEGLERLFSWKGMGVTGWLRIVANTQAFISLLLIGCLVYAYFL